MPSLIDTHCHIHDPSYEYDLEEVFSLAKGSGVDRLICIGTSAEDSEQAIRFASQHPGVSATVGIHPHDSVLGEDDMELLTRLASDKRVVAIGEFGLDYYYDNAPKNVQKEVCEFQLQLARSVSKPCVFHVRDAFSDFIELYDEYSGIPGVVHSFTGSLDEMHKCLDRGLYIALNGIMTFTKDPEHDKVITEVPLEKLLIETDSPYLTPKPLRGTMNSPANVRLVAAYLAELRGEPLDVLIEATTSNAQALFSLPSDTI